MYVPSSFSIKAFKTVACRFSTCYVVNYLTIELKYSFTTPVRLDRVFTATVNCQVTRGKAISELLPAFSPSLLSRSISLSCVLVV